MSNPCRIVPIEIHSPSVAEGTLKLPVAMEITLGENYGQLEHVTKFKQTTLNRQHKILSRVVTGSDRHGRLHNVTGSDMHIAQYSRFVTDSDMPSNSKQFFVNNHTLHSVH